MFRDKSRTKILWGDERCICFKLLTERYMIYLSH